MQTISLKLKYDGSHYHGWQRQNNVQTVQGTVEKALKRVLKQDISIDGSGRTDAGVHALGQCVTFKADLTMPVNNVKFALNKILPLDIHVMEARIVPDEFHARYSAIGKTYQYKIHTVKERDPFLERYSYHYPHELDIDRMRQAMVRFLGTHDFRTFMASGSMTQNTVRTIYDVSLEATDTSVIFTVTGNGFLYNMVRIIVGTLLHVGIGKITPEQIPEIIGARSRDRAKFTPPGCGLYLAKVYYDPEELVKFKAKTF